MIAHTDSLVNIGRSASVFVKQLIGLSLIIHIMEERTDFSLSFFTMNLLKQLTATLTQIGGGQSSQPQSSTLLFDSAAAASDVAFMVDGEWDGANGVVVSSTDREAWKTAAALAGANWCHSGDKVTLLTRMSTAALLARYQAGERYFCNANLRCAVLAEQNLAAIDLSWAKLNLAQLAGANLTCATLTAAELEKANLDGACLKEANFSRSNLKEVSLIGADLRGANLTQADLRNAVLAGADLRSANLTQTDLRGACLDEAQLTAASLTGAKLTK